MMTKRRQAQLGPKGRSYGGSANRLADGKKKNGKVVAHVMGWRTYGWNRPIWVPKDIIHTMDGSQKVWIPKTQAPNKHYGEFGGLARFGMHEQGCIMQR